MTSGLARLEQGCVALAQRVAAVAVVCMLVLSLATIVDVALRYFLSSPIRGLDEATQLIMAVIISASLPVGIARRNHITIDFFRGFLGRRWEGVLEALGGALLLALMLLLTWRFGEYANRLMMRGQITMIVSLPVAPFWWVVTAMLALCVPIQAVVFLNQVRTAMERIGGPRAGPMHVPGAIAAALGLAATALLFWAMVRFGSGLGTTSLAVVVFAAMWIPILILVPISVAMAFSGLLGSAALTGFEAAASTLAIQSAGFLSSLSLAVLPLFLMKGSFAVAAGLSNDAYRLAHALLGRYRGGLAMATIGSCAGFGAVTGSSLATAATIGGIALPEMRKRGYSMQLSTGCLAAGGTLGSLIPPSGIMVIYAVLTEQSIGKIFVASIVPAIVAAILYIATIAIQVRTRPGVAGPTEAVPPGEVLAALAGSWGVVLLFGAVIGGIYFGVFTANEAGAVGAGAAFLFALARGRLNGEAFWKVMGDVAMNTAMIYLLVFGAVMFSFFIGLTQIPQTLVAWIQSLQLAPLLVVAIILGIYLVLGCFIDPYTTLFITVPVVAPLIASMGYDLIWWGVLTVVVVEIGLITPPFGLNVFIIKAVAGEDVPLATVFRGIVPFLLSDIVKLALLVLVPAITLWLPSTMK